MSPEELGSETGCKSHLTTSWGFTAGSVVKNLSAVEEIQEIGFNPWAGKIPWKRNWQLYPVFLPREFHGRGTCVGNSPWDHKELDMTEYTHKQAQY